MSSITAIILTKNEELNIAKCINSIKPVVERIVVVDSGSSDRTCEIAKGLGAEVLVNELTPFLYAKQFLYGMEHADIKTKWVLRIDADEELTEESAAELSKICDENEETDVNGVVIRFKVNFMGRDLYHGGVYPFKKLLCFKYGKGNIEDRYMDEHIVLFEGRSVELKSDSLHHDFKDLTYWVNKHNSYSTREAQDYYAAISDIDSTNASEIGLSRQARVKRFIKYNIYYKLSPGFRTWLYYIYRCVIKGAFLDGREGRMYAFLQAYWYRYLVDCKIYEMRNDKEV